MRHARGAGRYQSGNEDPVGHGTTYPGFSCVRLIADSLCSRVTETLSFQSLTRISRTTRDIERNLHCCGMSENLIPFQG